MNELRRQGPGSAVVIVLIALAIAIGVCVSATERSLRQSSAQAAKRFDLLVGAAGSPVSLVFATVFLAEEPLDRVPPETLERLRADPGVLSADPVTFGDFAEANPVVGTTVEFVTDRGRIAPVEGRTFAGNREAVVGWRVARSVGEDIRFHHGNESRQEHIPGGHPGEFRIVGRLPATGTAWDNAILIDAAEFARMHRQDAAQVPAIVVRPRTVQDAYRLRATWRRGGTTSAFPGEVLEDLHARLGTVWRWAGLLAGLSQALVAGALALVMFLVVNPRALPSAAPPAFDAPRAWAFGVAWLQGTLLATAGVIAGVVAGYVATWQLGRESARHLGIAFTPQVGTPELLHAAGALGLAAALCAAIAFAISRRDLGGALSD